MKIIIGKTAGFCYGVKRAVESSEKELENTKQTIYCLGELVHNKDVTEKLREKGLIFIENINDAKTKAIIRAHGVQKDVYKQAKIRNIELVDLTCPNVLKIHNIVEEYSKKPYYIFLIGENIHPEVIGTYSFCGENSTIISNIQEVEEAINKFNKSQFKNILIISQTTYNLKAFDNIVKKIKENVANGIKIEVQNTICLATELRQKETEKISKEVDLMIIIGGRKSSNTNKLYEISLQNCKNVIFIQNKTELDIEKISGFEKIGIMAGASTPHECINEVVDLLKTKNEQEAVV